MGISCADFDGLDLAMSNESCKTATLKIRIASMQQTDKFRDIFTSLFSKSPPTQSHTEILN